MFVKWGSSDCCPCQQIQPQYDALAKSCPTAVFVCLEMDHVKPLFAAARIGPIPSFQVYVNGVLMKTIVGNPYTLPNLVTEYTQPRSDS